MSDPQRRQVRVRRSPKVGVFLAIGAVVGALVAIVAVNITPPDATVPQIQAVGFLILLLAPLGALAAGVVALVLDAIAERRARTVEAEWVAPAPAPVVEPSEAAEPQDEAAGGQDAAADRPLGDQDFPGR